MYGLGFVEVLIPYVAIFVLTYILSEIMERLWPYVPNIITSPIDRIWRMYLDFWRSLLPDHFYKLWLRTGIMEEDDYRTLQERGIIDDDIDPSYIQKNDSNR